ncbi:MAG: hypothetical protein IJG13_02265 [Kiritimatiellae bacterium]|nr:hypothetical protein [Kiritimatiellia bacterium]MBQ6328818.1 hypothetical protein [Kiritimatiellia bacterium]
MKVSDIKGKVAAKVAKGKAKIAAKCGKSGKAAKACAVLALLAVFAGCHMGEQPTAQRAQTANTEVKFLVEDGGKATFNFGAEFVSQAQANETSGTETMTASPSNTPTVSTPIQIDARYNDAMAAANNVSKGVLESLTTAGANKVLALMSSKETGTVEVQKKDGTTATVECKDGQCSLAGSGTCADGSCSDK